MQMLVSYPWPGNVRELENTMERILVLADGDVIEAEHLPEPMRRSRKLGGLGLDPNELSIKKMGRRLEEQLIRRALEKTGGNRTAATKLLEISHRSLVTKIRDYQIDL